MKTSLLIFLLLILSISLFTEELTIGEKFKAGNKEIADTIKKSNKTIFVSPLLSPRVGFGIITANKGENQHWIENNYQISGFYSEGLRTLGFVYKYNYFFGRTRKGFFTQLNIGFDYFYFTGLGISPGGSVPDSKTNNNEGLTPNLSSGFGYSFQLGEDSNLRLIMDIGYKWFLSNIYISYVW